VESIESSGPKVIRANQFILEDKDGKIGAELYMGRCGPALVLFDETGKPRVALTVNKFGAELHLLDKNTMPAPY